jgi:uncharacterized protein (TIGR02246 family)
VGKYNLAGKMEHTKNRNPVRSNESILVEEEKKILDTSRRYQAAWSKADIDLLGEFYTKDAVRFGSVGEVLEGREEIKLFYKRFWSNVIPESTYTQEAFVRMLTNELAVFRSNFEIVIPSKDGSIKGHAMALYKKKGNKWLIFEHHVKMFCPPIDF